MDRVSYIKGKKVELLDVDLTPQKNHLIGQTLAAELRVTKTAAKTS